MRILCLHVNSISYEAREKAFDAAEEIDERSGEYGEALAVFTAVEDRDEAGPDSVIDRAVEEIEEIAEQVNVDTVVLYPYVHLTADPGSPETAKRVLRGISDNLSYTTHRSPFGWYKSFSVDVKGHPLAELSREFGPSEAKGTEDTFTFEERALDDQEELRLSSALLVGRAVVELFPEAELGVIDLHHDQAFVDIKGVHLTSDHLPDIEDRARELIDASVPIESGDSAEGLQGEIARDTGHDTTYNLKDTTVAPLYPDPFVHSTDRVGALSVEHLSSAYWRGNSENEQLTRIYTVGFESEDALERYEERRREAEERSHTKLGPKMGLFFTDDSSPGSPFFLPKGTQVVNEMKAFLRDLYEEHGYEEVETPNIFRNDLWKRSGHWEHYQDDMFFLEDEEMALKPMNCPSHCIIYNNSLKSYRDLPVRIADFGALHRNELSGTLHGLTRVRRLRQDDAHIFCREAHIQDEVASLMELVEEVYEQFGLGEFEIELSTRPESSMGSDALWERAQGALRDALSSHEYEVNEGDGAFYGPKIDFHVTDSLGRSWQLGTIQVDFQLPKKFDLTFEGEDGQPHRPVMIHRALLGSLERFLGILIEHTEGNFPFWLNPVQVKILTIADRHLDYAENVVERLEDAGLRVELDDRMESVGKKVRDAQVEKVNYMLTVGDDEVDDGTVAVRDRDGDVEHGVDVDDFIETVSYSSA